MYGLGFAPYSYPLVMFSGPLGHGVNVLNFDGNILFDSWLDSFQVWAVLKPGFLAFLKDPSDPEPLDIIVFDVLPASDGNGEGRVSLAKEIKDGNPLRHYFRVSSF